MKPLAITALVLAITACSGGSNNNGNKLMDTGTEDNTDTSIDTDSDRSANNLDESNWDQFNWQ